MRQRIATNVMGLVFLLAAGIALAWWVAAQQPLWDIEAEPAAYDVPIASVSGGGMGNKVCVVHDWSLLTVYELPSFKKVAERRIGKGVEDVALHPSGKLVVATAIRDVAVWDLSSGSVNRKSVEAGWCTSVAFSGDGKRLATAGTAHGVKVWAYPSWNLICDIPRPKADLAISVALNATGDRVAFGIRTAELDPEAGITKDDLRQAKPGLEVWDVENAKPIKRFDTIPGEIRSVALSPSGRLVAAAGSDTANATGILLYDLTENRMIIRPRPELNSLRQVAFSGERLLYVSSHGHVVIVDTVSGKSIDTVNRGHLGLQEGEGVNVLAGWDSPQTFAVGGTSGTVSIGRRRR